MPRPLVLQTEHLDDAAAAWLAERCQLVRCGPDDPDWSAQLAAADGLVIRTYTKVNDAILAAAPNLKVVGRAGVGLDNVDQVACRARGVAVFNTPDANTRAVVEYVLALLCDVTRPRGFMQEALSTEDWKETREQLKARRQLCEMTLGIWGLGRIGKQLARAATALDMTVLYHDLLEFPLEQRFGAIPVASEELCRRADALSIHVDGRPENRSIVGADAFGRCKPDVVFINTSRGFVVDNLALADFMLGNPAACAILDVHEPEPFDAAYPLLEIENVHLSPHIASATTLAHRNMSWVVRDVWRALGGKDD